MDRKTVNKKYIPSQITKEWSDDGRTVSYINKPDFSNGGCLIDEAFSEAFIVDYGLNPDNEDFILQPLEVLDDIKNGDKLVLKNNDATVALFLASQYYLNRNSSGAIAVYIHDNIEKLKSINSVEGVLNFVGDVTARTRKYSERAYSIFLSTIKGMYLLDLKCTFLYADENASFVMGSQPLVMMNYLGKIDDLISYPFCYHGLILVMPITPRLAVSIYDDSVYKIKRKDGKTVLSDEDVNLINRYIAVSSDKVLYSSNVKNDRDYVLSLLEKREGIKDVESDSLSVFCVLASSIDLSSNTIREYCDELMCYDEEHSIEDENYNDDRFDYINELLERLGLDQ